MNTNSKKAYLNKNYLFLPYNKTLNQRAKELLKNQTAAEKKIFEECLSKLEYKTRRQKIIDNFIVDFYIAKLRLIIEIDGEIHDLQKEYDKDRELILKKYNLKIIRITNRSIIKNPIMTYKRLNKIINERKIFIESDLKKSD